MNRILVVCLATLAMALTAASFVGTTSSADTIAPTPTPAPVPALFFAGTWKGTLNNLPGIDLTIQQSDSKISGSVVFYFQKRSDMNDPWQATADPALPLLKPHATDRILTFEVEHHVCDGCKELGPNALFLMELTGANEARLTKVEEDGTEGPQMKLVRESTGAIQTALPPQRGISVEMPVTENALPVPEADQPGSLIVTVTVEGKVYVGLDPVDLDRFIGELKARFWQRSEKRLYIKADARAPYATVVKVLDAALAAGYKRNVLLTSQSPTPSPGDGVPPAGFTIVTGGD